MNDPRTWAGDIVAFAEHAFYIRANDGPIVLQPHQRAILRHAFTPDAGGLLPYAEVIYSAPKKSGKTAIGALVGLWYALREAGAEVYTVANDLEQAQGRVWRAICDAIDGNPILRQAQTRRAGSTIELTNGAIIQALASEYAGAAGANPSLVIFDELWAYTSERSFRLFEELTPVPTRPNSTRLVVTYAGFAGESTLLEGLYNRGRSGERVQTLGDLPCWANDRLFMYWDTEPRMPWQTADYYDDQRAALRPNAFLRMHRNQWVTGSESFIDLADFDACVTLPGPALPDPTLDVYVGVDASTKRDSSAAMAVTYDRQAKRLRLIDGRVWQPSIFAPLDFDATIGAYLRHLQAAYRVRHVAYDPWQMQALAQDLAREGILMHEYPQTPANMTQAGQTLLDALRGQTLDLYPMPPLRKAAAVAVATETPRGWRIDKAKASHKIDPLVALAMACAVGVEIGARPRGVYFA